jgi:hypothetical protein
MAGSKESGDDVSPLDVDVEPCLFRVFFSGLPASRLFPVEKPNMMGCGGRPVFFWARMTYICMPTYALRRRY